MRRARNDSRRAELNFKFSAKHQYTSMHCSRSIACLVAGLSTSRAPFSGAFGGGIGHDFFYFVGIAGQALAEKFVPGFSDQDVVLNAHAKAFFWDVDARFDSD